MKFDCQEISVSNEEFGYTLTLSEIKDTGVAQINMTIEEIINSSGQYLMLQRTFAEDEYEKDYYYIETKNPDHSGELKNFKIDIYRTQFVMTYEMELIVISLNLNDQEYESLKQVTKLIINKKEGLNFHDNWNIAGILFAYWTNYHITYTRSTAATNIV